MKRFFCILLVMITMVSVLFAGGASDESEDTGFTKIKVGVLPAMTALPIVDIVNNGLDKSNGIEIELISFTTGAPMNEAMAAGEIDASCIGAAGVFALANFNAKMISEICDDTVAIELMARLDSEIASIKGANENYPDVYGSAEALRGATILCPAGTLSQYEVVKYLDVFGLTLDDIKYIPMEYGQAYQAFVAGEGDIVATRSPQTFTAVDDQKWISVASLKNLNSSATAQIVVSDKAYTTKFDALAILVKLVHEQNDVLNNDIERSAQIMSDWFIKNGQKIDVAVSKKQLEAKPFYGVQDVRIRMFGSDFENTLVSFMISNQQLEASAKDTVIENIKGDVIQAAGLK